MEAHLIWVFVGMAFVLGAVVGSGLNVAIYRLPREKSMMWPSSRCGSCLQPVAFYDNIPLLSYWILRGRCRVCKARFSSRYFFIELFTGAAFAGLFYLDFVLNVNELRPIKDLHAWSPLSEHLLAGFYWLGHCLLVSYFIVTSMCDLDDMAIPLSVTIPGTLVGIGWSVLFPWPWPNTAQDMQRIQAENQVRQQRWQRGQLQMDEGPLFQDKLLIGAQPWPAWYPEPQWAPAGSWQLGLLNSLAGILVGSMLPRSIRFLFFLGRQKEGLGLGDADLMMMAGAFLGWQVTLVAFFVSVFPGLLLGIVQLIRRGDQHLPFGPPLALGTLVTLFCWRSIGPQFQFFFFTPGLLTTIAVFGAIFLVIASFVLRWLRGTG